MNRQKFPIFPSWLRRIAHGSMALLLATLTGLIAQPSYAQDKEVTVAYQQIVDP